MAMVSLPKRTRGKDTLHNRCIWKVLVVKKKWGRGGGMRPMTKVLLIVVKKGQRGHAPDDESTS